MSRSGRCRSAAVALAVSLLFAAALVACGESASEDPWSGTWREIGTPESYTLSITPETPSHYTVEYPRSFLVPFHAYLEDDRLIIWGENTEDVVWTVTYATDSDQLTAVGRDESISFRRVEE